MIGPSKQLDDLVIAIARELGKSKDAQADRMEIGFQESGEHVYRIYVRDEQYPVPGLAKVRPQ